MNFREVIQNYNSNLAIKSLIEKYAHVLKLLDDDNCNHRIIIWGGGRLGAFAQTQLINNGYSVSGFVDSNPAKQNPKARVFAPDVLREDDLIIVCSVAFPEIEKKLREMGVLNYIFYELLVMISQNRFEHYNSPLFSGMFKDVEDNKDRYLYVYNKLADQDSRDAFENVMMFRMTMNAEFLQRAQEISVSHGPQDFDEQIIERMDENSDFFDVGGYDGGTTLDFIRIKNGRYGRIFFIEPDRFLIEKDKGIFASYGYDRIVFINGIAWDRKGYGYIEEGCPGDGKVVDDAEADNISIVEKIVLDDYIDKTNSYIKLDVEGSENSVITGMSTAISKYHPLLGISVYHICGDFYKLTEKVLSQYDGYSLVFRHYTGTYNDSMIYFIDDSA